MGLRERFQKTITMTVLQRQCMLIATMFFTLCLLRAWPRVLADALSLDWYVYLILGSISLIPLLKKHQ